MDARAVEDGTRRLRLDRRASRAHVSIAAGLAALAIVSGAESTIQVTVAFAAASVVEALVAGGLHWRRRGAIETLALDIGAHDIPEVRDYACGLTTIDQRARMARRLEGLAPLVAGSETAYLRDRVLAHESDLRRLARELTAPDAELDPLSAVECLRLLENAVASPLCNPKLDHADVVATLYRIRAGIRIVS